MHEQTDIEREWLVKLSRGDESVFRRLFDRYHPFVYSFALRMTESDPIAKDVVQDVFVKIWVNRESLHTIENLPAYLNRMTRNLVLNGMKRKAHEESLLRDLFPAGNERNSTEDAALAKELEALLHRAIAHLPAQQQKVYRLGRMKGLKHEDIAAELHISRETVKKHMMAAIRGVKDYLQEHGGPIGLLAVCLLRLYR